MKQILTYFLFGVIFCLIGVVSEANAQDADDVKIHEIEKSSKNPRFLFGGYGEVALQRMFYTDNIERYKYPERHKDGNHGRFDLPHVVLYMSYDFGKGWKMSSEIEFEHGGTGTTYEIENSETGEYETEIEKGGEIALEQFWIEKTFSPIANLRMGHIIVPIGLTNMYHMPTEFFSVLRPEEESSIIPCTWHETGVSFWGRTSQWRYEAMLVAGLDAERFNNANWINGGAVSPYEFKIANRYAGAVRIDNYSVKGLRMGVSGYYGYSAQNTLKQERYNNVKGAVSVGAFDAVYDAHNILARTNILYGHLGDSYDISMINKKMPNASPSPGTDVASDVLSWYVEAGYNVLSFFPNLKKKDDKLYVYAHYGSYDSMYKTSSKITPKGWTDKKIISGGINYFPMKGLVVKAEYMMRKFKAPYNNEPAISLGIGYSGLFGN
ncbi:MAG: hypothetical protein LBL58_04210 [Tannerellaceae bacterium]|jgi:hypothetical protein|nr:hypothetical protein [Tannerellaceae bacterium]